MMSLGFSIERSTWWPRTPCSAWIGAKSSYVFFQASKSATRWRTRAMVLVMSAPFRSDAPLRTNGLQEKRATKATLSSLLLGSKRFTDERNRHLPQVTFPHAGPNERTPASGPAAVPHRSSGHARLARGFRRLMLCMERDSGPVGANALRH